MLDYRHCTLYPLVCKATNSLLGYLDAISEEELRSRYKTMDEELHRFAATYLDSKADFAGGMDTPTLADYSIVPGLAFTTARKGYQLPARVERYVDAFLKAVPTYAPMRAGFLRKVAELAKATEDKRRLERASGSQYKS
uniref:GST C-terminal domain-containing protein n=2 Tax=Lotharella oceanica TaxID=641309 RepID=A0A7S2U370_9EUKA|mmetsp:Transcript_8214/g.16155  ORF Transcript_8214/g.16155 Transcript_8214/m.16155 type:complete len:139 (+) Transcript_8214:525-941(+)